MFTKSKSHAKKSPENGAVKNTGKLAPPSIISSDMYVKGNLETEGDVQIDGKIDGDLKTFNVTVGKGATVNGEIHGQRITISGNVNGQIRGDEVLLSHSAHVVGDIHHKTLSIDAGAFLQGLCQRISGTEDVKKVDANSKSAKSRH
jgi:cytoskeletal protein CcmA (bactofilin family)